MPILPSPGPRARAVRGSPAAARRPTRLPLRLLRTCPHPAKPNRFGKRWALGSGACLQPRARRPTPSPSREHGAAGSPLPPPNLGGQTLDMRSGDFPKLPAPESRRQTRGSREPARPTAQRAGRERGAPGRRRRTRTQLPRHRDCDTDQGLEGASDSHLPRLAALGGGEGAGRSAQRRAAGACGVGELTRGCWGGRGAHLQSLASRRRGVHARGGRWNRAWTPNASSDSLHRAGEPGGRTPFSANIPAASPPRFLFPPVFSGHPPTQRRLQRSRQWESGCAPNPSRAGSCAQLCPANPHPTPHHARSPPTSRAGPGLGAPALASRTSRFYLEEPKLRAPSHPWARSVTGLDTWLPRTSQSGGRAGDGGLGRMGWTARLLCRCPAGPAGSGSSLLGEVRPPFPGSAWRATASRPPRARAARAASRSAPRPSPRRPLPLPLSPPLPSVLPPRLAPLLPPPPRPPVRSLFPGWLPAPSPR